MILDALTTVSSGQLINGAAAVSTDKIDPGAGEPMAFVVTVDIAASDVAAAYVFDVVSDEDAALGSPTVHLTRSILGSLLTEGAQIVLDVPPGPHPYERYLGLRYTALAGDTVTVSAALVPRKHIPFTAYYPAAYES
jgi:hypothetical protein